MQVISKLTYQAHIKGLDVDKNDGVKIKNSINKKYIKILPNGKIFSGDIFGHDKDLKDLMPKNFIIKDPFSGSFVCLPCKVSLHVGRETTQKDITFAKDCLNQCFENVKNFKVVKDDDLLPTECWIDHSFDLSFKERQAFIKACLEYLK